MRALVVDDEKLIVKGLKFNLEQEGYEVDCAYDGQEAVDLAKENEYDIILLDLMLPVFDGYEVCQQVREFSDVPIVMLTAKGEDMDKILGDALFRQRRDEIIVNVPHPLRTSMDHVLFSTFPRFCTPQ